MGVIPAVRVELFVGLDRDAPYLTLDDPVKGEIDEALYPLYDGVLPSITADLEADAYAYSVRRGRSSELDDVSTGTLAVSFRNFAGTYVPSTLVSTGSDVYLPGKRVRLWLDEVCVFDGTVDDWQLSYDLSGDCSAELVAFDALGSLADTELQAWSTSAQTAGERLVAILDRPEVDFPATRDVSNEAGSIGADTVPDGTNTLTYVRQVVYSDLGYVYASRLGLLTFEPRQSIAYVVQAEFADDGTAIPFVGIVPSSSARYLFNRVSVMRAADGAVEQIVNDTASQALYGIRTLTLSDMLMNSDTDALNLAGSLLSLYSTPATRIESLSVNLGSLTESQRATVCALELGDFVTVTWTPKGTTATTQSLRVEGIEWGGSYSSLGTLMLNLSPASQIPIPFLLDDVDFGVLDTSTVYY